MYTSWKVGGYTQPPTNSSAYARDLRTYLYLLQVYEQGSVVGTVKVYELIAVELIRQYEL